MKGDKKGKVHCECCFKLIKDVEHAYIDEEDNFHFLCVDCYLRLKPFYKGRGN